MRNNSHVRVTPSDSLGRPNGVTIDGVAVRADGDEEIKISQLLYRKYGLMKMSFDLWEPSSGSIGRSLPSRSEPKSSYPPGLQAQRLRGFTFALT